jgi:hypothetical protein
MIALKSPTSILSGQKNLIQRNFTQPSSRFKPLQFGDKTGFEQESTQASKPSLRKSGPPTTKMPKWVYGLLLVGGGFLGLGFCNSKQAEVSPETSAPLVQMSPIQTTSLPQTQIHNTKFQDATSPEDSKLTQENQSQSVTPSPVSIRPTQANSTIIKPEKTPREPGARNLSH